MLKVLIIENDYKKAYSYSEILNKIQGVELLGVVSDKPTAMIMINNNQPDVVFCNPKLSLEGNVIPIALEIRKKCDSKIIVLGKSLRIKEEMNKLHPYEYIQDANNINEYKNLFSSLKNKIA